MNYIGTIYRPPSEAESLILQITVGCSYNQCTFCPNYKAKKFFIKDMETIKRDIDEACKYNDSFDRVFLADGDALIMPTDTLLEIMAYIKDRCPQVKRFGLYANTKSINLKKPEELGALKKAGLGIVYQGIESGNREVLKRVKKGATPPLMIKAAAAVSDAGIKLSQMVLLGLGGVELSKEHALDTAKILSEMSPDFAAALTVIPVPGTPFASDVAEGKIVLPDKFDILKELLTIIKNFDGKRPCFFTSNHASNYLPIKVRLPEERDQAVSLIKGIIDARDEDALRPEYAREKL
jgi:radical SAM superfamily enzyme YgiQ (UPF0313 family)